MSSKARVVVTFGSNIDRERKIPEAIRCIKDAKDWSVLAVSPIYENASIGGTGDEPHFFNGAVLLETELAPEELKNRLREIEDRLGRVRTEYRAEPRTIDLDIVLFDDRIMQLGTSAVPDPNIGRYPYLAIPIADIVPDWVHPELGTPLRELAAAVDTTTHPMRLVDVRELSVSE